MSGSFTSWPPHPREQVQGNSPKLPNMADKKMIVCVIDSGMYADHPDFVKGGAHLNGCKVRPQASPAAALPRLLPPVAGM